jgi:signal transduction histidine kinase
LSRKGRPEQLADAVEAALQPAAPAHRVPEAAEWGHIELVNKKLLETLEQLVDVQTTVSSAHEAIDRARREFDADSEALVHDLRSPLNAVGGFAQILAFDEELDLPERGRRYLETIRRNAARMGDLIDGLEFLLSISRRSPILRTVETRPLVERAFAAVAPRDQQPPSSIAIGKLPATRADEDLLLRVFQNLLSNAVKFTRDAEVPTIRVHAAKTSEEDEWYVTDNGVGFDPRHANRLFRPFTRLHSSNEYEGVGLGLAVSDRIVSLHHGRMWADSLPGGGATFGFALPRAA